MTQEQLEQKYNELIEQAVEDLKGSLHKIIQSGAVDIQEYDDDYRLPKLIICAASRRLYDQFRPLSKELTKESYNMYLFL